MIGFILAAFVYVFSVAVVFGFTSGSWENIGKPARPFMGFAMLWPAFVIRWFGGALADGVKQLRSGQ